MAFKIMGVEITAAVENFDYDSSSAPSDGDILSYSVSSMDTPDDNAVWNDEFDTDLTAWDVTTNASVESGYARLDGDGATIERTDDLSGSDTLLYAKFKTVFAATKYGYFGFGSATPVRVYFDYNTVTSTVAQGTLSAKVGTANLLLATGVDTSSWVEMLMHVDINVGAVNYYTRSDNTYTFLGSIPYGSAFGASTFFAAKISSGDSGQELHIDYLSACRPNIISIGDSITAGHNYFDPASSYYSGIDPYDNCYQSYVNVLTGCRNSHVINKGIGGENSTERLARWTTDVVSQSCRICIITGGLNDYNDSMSMATRDSNYQSMITQCFNAGILSVLTSCTAPPNSGAEGLYYKDWNDNYYPNYTNVDIIVDILDPIDIGSDGYVDVAYLEGDERHPNSSGYELIGGAIEDAIIAHYSATGESVYTPLNFTEAGVLEANSVSGSFTTVDSKTITIVDGQVVSIV